MSDIQAIFSGEAIVSANDIVENATVLSGGVLIVLHGGSVLNTNVSGGYIWMLGGTAVDTLLLGENTYVGCISSGAVTSRTSAVGSRSYEIVRSGGTSLQGTFYDGAYQLLSEGGLASETLLSGGSVIQRGGMALDTEIGSGYLWMSGGTAIDTLLLGENTYVGCISFGAVVSRTSAVGLDSYEMVRSGGTSIDGRFFSGTYQLIREGGVVSNAAILEGAWQYISSGAVIQGDIELWGNMYGRERANASEATAHLHPGGGRIYGYDNLSGLSITLDVKLESASSGYYLLASGCTDFTGSFTVRNEDGLAAFEMQLDEEVHYKSKSYLLRNPGGNLVLLVSTPLRFGFGTYSEMAWHDGHRALITHFDGLDKGFFSVSNGVYSYYNEAVVDAEKVDATELDDQGCGEAAGTNMLFMTGWAQLAGYESEDQLFREFYLIDGTADYGWLSVMKHVFNQLPEHSIWNYYSDLAVNATLFNDIEERLRAKQAVCILYDHGTPNSHDGNHALTVWGLVYDENFSANDPRHYTAMIVSDSDDNDGYATAEDAPNRLKTVALTWDSSEQVYCCDDGYIVSAAALGLAPSAELHSFGNTQSSTFYISGSRYGFLVGVSGLTYQDFSPSGSYSVGYDEYVNENIIDAEKYASSNVDDYWCQVLTNINQLVYGGWAQMAGYPDEDALALELVENPSLLDGHDTSWEYLFSQLPQYRLDDYTHMFRMVGNDGVSLGNANAMAEVDAYMRWSNSSVYLQLDWGSYGAKTGSHAITMYGFTYDLSYSPDDPRYYNGVIISDSDNNKQSGASGNLAPNSLSIIPIEWDAQNKVYWIFSNRAGIIRFFWGLDNAPEGESPIDTTAPTISNVAADTTAPTNGDVTVTAVFADDVALASAQFQVGEGDWRDYGEGVVVGENAVITFRATDTAGNTTTATYAVTNIDKAAPTISDLAASTTAPTNGAVTVTASFSDDVALASAQFQVGAGDWRDYGDGVVVGENAVITFRATDTAGNTTTATYAVTNIDKAAPVIVLVGDNTTPLQAATLAASTEEGVSIEWSADNETWATYTGELAITSNGTWHFRATDAAGNTGYAEITFANIDSFLPVVSADVTEATWRTVTVSATFAENAVSREWRVGEGEWQEYTGPVTVAENCVVEFRGTDAAENASTASYEVANIVSPEEFVRREFEGDIGFGTNFQDNFALDVALPGMYTLSGDFSGLNGSVEILNGKKKVASGTVKKGVLTFNKGKTALLDAGDYTVVVKKSDKGMTAFRYSFALEGTAVFTKGDNSDDWGDVKTKGAAGAVGDAGPLTTGTVVADWVGFGDAIDYQALTLESGASVALDVASSDAVKVAVWSLTGTEGKFKLKSVGNVTPKLNKATGQYTASTKALLLNAGTYYLSVQSTNAAKGGNADYTVSVNAKSAFFTEGDNSDDAWANAPAIAVGEALEDWVGLGDAVDYRTIAVDAKGGFYSFDLSGAENGVKMTVYSVVNGKLKSVKSVSASAKKPSVSTGALALAGGGTYVLAVEAPGAKKAQNSHYTVEMEELGVFATGNNTWATASEAADGLAGCLGKGGDTVDWFDLTSWEGEFSLKMEAGSVKASFYDENQKAVKLTSVIYADGSVKSGVASLTLKDGDRLTDVIHMAAVAETAKYLKIEAVGTGMGKYSLLA